MYADGKGSSEREKRLTRAQVKRLDKALKGNENPLFKRTTKRGRVAHAVVFVLFKLGLRSVEIQRMKMQDIEDYESEDGTAGLSIAVHGKGGRWRRLLVFGETAEYLRKYSKGHAGSKAAGAPFFPAFKKAKELRKGKLEYVTDPGRPISMGSIQHIVREIGKAAGISHKSERVGRSPSTYSTTGRGRAGVRRTVSLSPHQLRHTRISIMAEKGYTAFDLMAWAGHSQLATAQRYVKLSGRSTERMGMDLD